MKKPLIFFLFFIFIQPLYANKIDALETDEEVEEFLQKLNKDFGAFYVAPIKQLYPDTVYQKIADSLGVKPWQKTDFNNDGLTDLLVYGILGVQKYLIVVMDKGTKFSIRYLNRGLSSNPYLPTVKTLNQQTLLILHTSCEFCKNQSQKIIKTDTLAYQFGDFIEANFNVKDHHIAQIDFSTSTCYGTCSVFELSLKSDGSAVYNAIENNPKNGKYTATIDTANYNEIQSLINYIDFQNLENYYKVNWTDDQSSKLVITYSDGKTKTITDYGMYGTNGLALVYNKLFALRKKQDWKKAHN
jgi:hypothetical protein